MSVVEIPAHCLEFPEMDKEIELLESLLVHAYDDVQVSPDSLGIFFNDYLRVVGFKVFLEYSQQDIISTLRDACDFGVALFIRGNAHPNTSVNVTIDGQPLTLQGGASDFNTALNWLSAYGIAAILRDHQAIETLCHYHSDNFEGTYDQYHITLAKALMAFSDNSQGTKKLLSKALREANTATLFPKRAQIKGAPLIKLAQAVLYDSNDQIFEYACRSLQGHYEVSKHPSDNYMADLYLPYLIVGLCAMASDKGTIFNITCHYFPKYLVNNSL